MVSKFIIISMLLLSSCASVNIISKDLPPKAFVPKDKAINNSPLIFMQNELSLITKPYYCIVDLRVWGNAPSKESDLLIKLKEEAKKNNVDIILRSDLKHDSSNSQNIYLGYGISQSSPIRLPIIDSSLCNFAKVYAGIRVEKDGMISYVTDNSPAAKAGLKEGFKILKYNNTFVDNNPYANALEISTKNPGDILLVEYLDLKGNKAKKEITLEPIK